MDFKLYKELKMIELFCCFLLFFCCPSLFGQDVHPLHFRKQMIAAESYESVAVFDVNNDKILDIVSGSFWYEGPLFLKRHYMGEVKQVGEYYDDFSTIPMDVNGDGKIDYITGGWWGNTLRWKENPGSEKAWKEHIIAEVGNVETTRAWDIDGDGFDEIVPNTPGKPLAYYTLNRDRNKRPLGTFTRTQVAKKHGHGLGFGDLNKDGRGDFIVSDGWFEAPVDRTHDVWTFHGGFDLGLASVPIIITDVNQDGYNDFIAGNAHGYGLNWYEQKHSGKEIKWIKHPIDPFQAQYHTMILADIDNDGKMELITGKRYRAHNGHDLGDNDPPGLYYFKWNGESFTKNIICYGELGVGKGTGIYFAVADLRNSGRKDIIVAGKDGLFVFFNEGE